RGVLAGSGCRWPEGMVAGGPVVFFFQAEDGIRDWSVTGVQTCALPIWKKVTANIFRCFSHSSKPGHRYKLSHSSTPLASNRRQRSEERRVGKEGRRRWGGEELKKKKRRT